MVTEVLVDNYLEDGAKLVSALKNGGIDVSLAFWAKVTEESHWFLYIASPLGDDQSQIPAYGNVYGVLRKLSLQWLTESDIKLIRLSSSTAQDVLRLSNNWAGPTVARKSDVQIGNMFVEELYIYPKD